MHLMSCEHPQRVYNKYIDQFVWVPCGKCNSCKNRRAKKWTDACERERSSSLFTLFVTLTYDELSLPVYNATGGFDEKDTDFLNLEYLVSSRERDVECMAVSNELFDDDADKQLFYDFLSKKGIPYASRTDIQLFHKRLNKYFHDNVTNKYQNFRYFIVSEFGSTTLRPHFHALYFINDSEVARRFSDGILSCWKFGRTDCQYVENSACSYVAQYINKLFDLPSFYKAAQIRPFFLFSRNPVIGSNNKYGQDDEEIFDSGTVQTFNYKRSVSKLVLTEIDESIENRLYPKCPYFSQVSDSLRVELYSIACRFQSKSFRGFTTRIMSFLYKVYDKYDDDYLSLIRLITYDRYGYRGVNEFTEILRKSVDGFSESGINWLRRLYYLSRKVYKNALRFGISIFAYVQKIDEYYKNKELHLINKMYEFQQNYMDSKDNSPSVDDLVLMYPEYLHDNGFSVSAYLSQFTPKDVIVQRKDAAYFAFSNKRTHFKNLYLDSLKDRDNRFYNSLKNYFYAKKRNEIAEAFAS